MGGARGRGHRGQYARAAHMRTPLLRPERLLSKTRLPLFLTAGGSPSKDPGDTRSAHHSPDSTHTHHALPGAGRHGSPRVHPHPHPLLHLTEQVRSVTTEPQKTRVVYVWCTLVQSRVRLARPSRSPLVCYPLALPASVELRHKKPGMQCPKRRGDRLFEELSKPSRWLEQLVAEARHEHCP